MSPRSMAARSSCCGRGAGGSGRQHLVVELDPAPALLLGPVHGGVGAASEALGVVAGVVADGHADAGRDGRRVARAQRGVLAEDLPHPPAEGHRVVAALDGVDDHHELVTGQAADEVGVRRDGEEAAGDHLQELVAAHVAEGVVDRLEPVDVDEQEPDLAADLGGGVETALQLGQQHAPVGQAGEGIVGRLEQELEIGLALAGDVVEGAHHPLDAG